MGLSKLRYFFPVATISVAARLFFYPWDFELEPFGPVYLGTLLIMIFGIITLVIMLYADRERKK